MHDLKRILTEQRQDDLKAVAAIIEKSSMTMLNGISTIMQQIMHQPSTPYAMPNHLQGSVPFPQPPNDTFASPPHTISNTFPHTTHSSNNAFASTIPPHRHNISPRAPHTATNPERLPTSLASNELSGYNVPTLD